MTSPTWGLPSFRGSTYRREAPMRKAGSSRWLALGAVSLSVLAVSLDGTVLSVALPTLAEELDASQADLVWFSAGYLLVLAAAVLPAGLLGDRFGRKKVMLSSLLAFGLGSAVCAYATSVGVFLAGRLLQGLAGAGITVMALSALIVLFEEQERPKAVGIYQAANFIALPLGPILGGWMLSSFWWGWVFLINVPVVLLAVAVGAALIPESRATQRPGLDPLGMVGSTLGLALVIYGLIEAAEKSWRNPAVLVSIVGGAAVLAGFAAWERRLGHQPDGQPLIDTALFRSASFVWGAVLTAVAGLAMIGVLFTMPQYFQGIRGVDTLGSGLRLLPLIGGMVLGAGLASRLTRAFGPRISATAGFVLLAAGLGAGAGTSLTAGNGFVAGWTAVVGLGTGLALVAATAAALSGLSVERSGTESAVVQAFNKTSGPLGTAIMGSVLVAVYHARLDSADLDGVSAPAAQAARRSLSEGIAVAREIGSPALEHASRAAFVHGLSVALLVSAGIAVVGAVAAAAFLPHRDSGRSTGAGPTSKEASAHAVAG
ncbi:DHA2 family efflux MFS transporter permease subunit [Micromonospora sp. NPDC048935]|uniref:DHA2 family efflux MFS transporter permease subunit n=1 Tax=Micromonospora sp. NPDC048935 TaxID=3364262 RepID=UPI0037212500